MKLSRSPAAATCRDQLFDAVIDGYVTWREESLAVGAAYHNWRRAARDERGLAFAAHFVALDCEEHAAVACRRVVEQIAA
jgi:hypothetical protein